MECKTREGIWIRIAQVFGVQEKIPNHGHDVIIVFSPIIDPE